jgi:hypothetical protein
MIECYKKIVKHQLVWKEDEKGPHLFLLAPKTKVKVNNNVWFVKPLMGKNTLVATTWHVTQNIES